MSCTEMVFFGKNGRVCEEAEINNAWRGAMAVWQHLGQKYVLGFSNVILDSKKVWSLADDARLSMSEKICLCSTFDNQIAYKKDFKRLSEAFRAFGGTTSLPDQADVIDSAAENGEIIAVAWNQTSVNENKWTCEKYDDDDEPIDGSEYCILDGLEHQDMFQDAALKE